MKLHSILLSILLTFAACQLCRAQSGIPRVIGYQGVILNDDGTPLTDGVERFRFSLHTAATGGTLVWSESKDLMIENGLFATMLGSTVPIDLAQTPFNAAYYLEIQLPDAGKILPRIEIASVAYSLRSAVADSARHAYQALTALNAQFAQSALRADSAAVADEAVIADSARVAGLVESQHGGVRLPPGCILAYGGAIASIPPGWMLCDGRVLDSADYPALFAVLADSWGGQQIADSRFFNLPDLRGRFIRGVDGGAGIDPDAADRRASNTNGNAGDAVGSLQGDTLKSHSHATQGLSVRRGGLHDHGGSNDKIKLNAGWTLVSGVNAGLSKVAIPSPMFGSTLTEFEANLLEGDVGEHSHTIVGELDATGGAETRPLNASVNFIIKVE